MLMKLQKTIDVLPNFRAKVLEGWSSYIELTYSMAQWNQLRAVVPSTIQRQWWSLMTRNRLTLRQD